MCLLFIQQRRTPLKREGNIAAALKVEHYYIVPLLQSRAPVFQGTSAMSPLVSACHLVVNSPHNSSPHPSSSILHGSGGEPLPQHHTPYMPFFPSAARVTWHPAHIVFVTKPPVMYKTTSCSICIACCFQALDRASSKGIDHSAEQAT